MKLEHIGTAFGVRPCGPPVIDRFGAPDAVVAAYRLDWTPARKKEAVLFLAELGRPINAIASDLALSPDRVERLAGPAAVLLEPGAGGACRDDDDVDVLSVVQHRCLRAVARSGGVISKRTIAAELDLSVGAVGRALAALESGGYIAGDRSQAGRVTWCLSAKGLALVGVVA